MDDESTVEKDFYIDNGKTGRAACKRCKKKCKAGELRIAKLVPNHYSENAGKLKNWFHVECIFESFKTQKDTTKRIESVDDLDGWEALNESDRDTILEKFEGSLTHTPRKPKASAKIPQVVKTKHSLNSNSEARKSSEDNFFANFRSICDKIASVSGYTQKSKILQSFLIKGTNGKKFEGDIYLWFKLLLPSAVKRVYNLQSKQLIKVFSRIFRSDQSEMLIDLEQGDVSETIRKYFNFSKAIQPKLDSKLTLHDVDEFLEKLTGITREDDQIQCFEKLCETCNADDVKTVIRLIKHDLRMNAGPRHVLDALSPLAYSAFQSSRDLESVVSRFAPSIAQNEISSTEDGIRIKANSDAKASGSSSSSGVQLMCPISPMLAEACKSVEKAITKNPMGMYSEIKYDGERVQIHKRGDEFKFFSRNLKPVLDHKIKRCKEFIPKAFPAGKDLILDSEIIVVNTKTGKLLPFGTLGVHKREQFESAEVCLFVFDCIYYNGEDLTKKTLKERKKVLKDNMKPIKNHVQLSEYYLLKTKSELSSMTANVLKAGLEGLVLKSVSSLYEPGKRGWLKIKKDYLFQGQMADTADLVVLGAWFGTGKKGGMLSIFLMGCFDARSKLWRTVTKVHGGLDDSELEELQNVFKPLMERAVAEKPPKWLACKKQLMPDYVAVDPKKMPVWEITGAEFTKAEAHTANGISIRFPRITRMRHDKSTTEATSLDELELLFKNSKEHINVDMLFKDIDMSSDAVDIKTKLFDLSKEEDDEDDNVDGKNDDDEEDIDDDEKTKNLVNETSGSSSSSSNRKRRSNEILYRTPKKTKHKDMSKYKADFDRESNDEKKVKYKLNEVLTRTEDDMKLSIKDGNELLANIKCEPTLIFTDIEVYLKANVEKHFDTIRDEFVKAGGKIVENSRRATHVLHRRNDNTEDFMLVRKNYDAQCRHVTYKWIQDCIRTGQLLPLGKYAVRL